MKYAILDTDFILKLYAAKNNKGEPLVEKIFLLQNYCFFCHEQIAIEVNRHKNSTENIWLQQHISSGQITCLSDIDLIKKIQEAGITSLALAFNRYLDLLKQACSFMSSTYYGKYYSTLDSLDELSIDRIESEIRKCDAAIGIQNNLGEIKDALLANCFIYIGEIQVYQFCSDDRKARSQIVSLMPDKVRCISVIGFFYILTNFLDVTAEESNQFIESFILYNKNASANNLRVKQINKNLTNERTVFNKVPLEQIFDDIKNKALIMTNDGFLMYK